MKRYTICFVLLALLAATGNAFAEDTKVSVGLKAWANSWESKTEYKSGGSDTVKLGSAFMVGPSVNARFSNNMFIGASYLVTTKDYSTDSFVFTGDKLEVSRQDLDFTLGYMFIPQFGVFVGYKSINADLTYTYAPAGLNQYDLGTWSISGPGIGVLGNIPLSDMVALYGSLAIMSLTQEIKVTGDPTQKSDLTGASLEIGLAFAFSDAVSANIGIKSQSFTGEDKDTKDTYTDTFSGVTFGINYIF